jgi:hypothetical protein
MGTKTSATHFHLEIHRVGGDIGSVVYDFFIVLPVDLVFRMKR